MCVWPFALCPGGGNVTMGSANLSTEGVLWEESHCHLDAPNKTIRMIII